MSGCATISTPIRPKRSGANQLFGTRRRTPRQPSASYLPGHRGIFCHPQAGFAWNVFGDGRTVVRSGFGIYRDQLPAILFSLARALPPSFGLEEFVFTQLLNPQNAAETLPLDGITVTYRPKFPYALEYNLNVE